MTNKELDAWERKENVLEVLTSLEFGAWLNRRDKNKEALERPRGKWIRITQGAMPEQYICPFCHRTVEAYGVEELLSIRYPYCHCGADMRGDKDDGR